MNMSNGFDDDDDDEDIFDPQEEQIDVLEPVESLFSKKTFPNVIEMFRSEFDLIEFIRQHQIASQYDYIRLINYIRREVQQNKKDKIRFFNYFHSETNDRTIE